MLHKVTGQLSTGLSQLSKANPLSKLKGKGKKRKASAKKRHKKARKSRRGRRR